MIPLLQLLLPPQVAPAVPPASTTDRSGIFATVLAALEGMLPQAPPVAAQTDPSPAMTAEPRAEDAESPTDTDAIATAQAWPDWAIPAPSNAVGVPGGDTPVSGAVSDAEAAASPAQHETPPAIHDARIEIPPHDTAGASQFPSPAPPDSTGQQPGVSALTQPPVAQPPSATAAVSPASSVPPEVNRMAATQTATPDVTDSTIARWPPPVLAAPPVADAGPMRAPEHILPDAPQREPESAAPPPPLGAETGGPADSSSANAYASEPSPSLPPHIRAAIRITHLPEAPAPAPATDAGAEPALTQADPGLTPDTPKETPPPPVAQIVRPVPAPTAPSANPAPPDRQALDAMPGWPVPAATRTFAPMAAQSKDNGPAPAAAGTAPHGEAAPMPELAATLPASATEAYAPTAPAAPAQSTAASLPLAAPPGAHYSPMPLPSAMVAALRDATGSEGIELTLTPEELGPLRLSMVGEGDLIRIVVQAERPDTLDLVRRHADLLVQELRQAGFAGADLSFGHWQERAPPQPPAPVPDVVPPPEPPAPDWPQAPVATSGLDLRL